ncbi:MAG: D-Ala-D-Ala carboxypeptidase family metallohydrolase [Bradymonadia bacterium]
MGIRPYNDLLPCEIASIERRLCLSSSGRWSAEHEQALSSFRRAQGLMDCAGMDEATSRALERIPLVSDVPIHELKIEEDSTWDTHVTEHFTWDEFRSPGDGLCVPDAYRPNIVALCRQLEIVRSVLGNRRVTIVSGWRSSWWNRRSGGSHLSPHLTGMAADFTVEGLHPSSVRRLMESLMECGELQDGGLGRMAQHTHYDLVHAHARFHG